jgi:hypothetical protein
VEHTETKLQQNTIYSEKWHEKGLNYIDQLFDFRAKAFYKIAIAKHILNLDKQDFLKYHHLISVMPKSPKENVSMHFLYRNKEDVLIGTKKISCCINLK